jgi:hypothetical protein
LPLTGESCNPNSKCIAQPAGDCLVQMKADDPAEQEYLQRGTMKYFLVTGSPGEKRSERKIIAGPFEALGPVIDVLDLWLDQRMRSRGPRYHWWIDQEGPDLQLVVETKPIGFVL